MCPARRRARRTTSALLEVAMQSAFQEKCSYTMAVRCLLGELNSNASYDICSLEFFRYNERGALVLHKAKCVCRKSHLSKLVKLHG